MASGPSDYLENKLIDWLWRAQTFAPPATKYLALFTSAPSASGGGIEVSGGSYARVSVSASLTAFSGTQGAGTTAVSTGTSGVTSNNANIAFAAPTADWGTVTHWALFDASTGGNLLMFGALATPVTVINGGLAPTIPAGALSLGLYPVA